MNENNNQSKTGRKFLHSCKLVILEPCNLEPFQPRKVFKAPPWHTIDGETLNSTSFSPKVMSSLICFQGSNPATAFGFTSAAFSLTGQKSGCRTSIWPRSAVLPLSEGLTPGDRRFSTTLGFNFAKGWVHDNCCATLKLHNEIPQK